MNLPVYNRQGEKTSQTVELDPAVFGIEPNDHVMYLAVKTQLAHMRQGTHASKNRKLVSGGGRKPFRQKGRGTARAGTTRSPIWRHGGTTFGPTPHDYNLRLPRKVVRLARMSALSARTSEEAVRVIEDFHFDAPRTGDLVKILKDHQLDNEKVLILVPQYDENLYRSSRNIQLCHVQIAVDVSTYDLLNFRKLLIMKGAIEPITEVLSGRKRTPEKTAEEATTD